LPIRVDRYSSLPLGMLVEPELVGIAVEAGVSTLHQ